jgi:hypothetical protein
MKAEVTRAHRELAWRARYPWTKDQPIPAWALEWVNDDKDRMMVGNPELVSIAAAFADQEASLRAELSQYYNRAPERQGGQASAFEHGVIEGRRYPTGSVLNPYPAAPSGQVDAQGGREQHQQLLDIGEWLAGAMESEPWSDISAYLQGQLQEAENRGWERRRAEVPSPSESTGAWVLESEHQAMSLLFERELSHELIIGGGTWYTYATKDDPAATPGEAALKFANHIGLLPSPPVRGGE